MLVVDMAWTKSFDDVDDDGEHDDDKEEGRGRKIIPRSVNKVMIAPADTTETNATTLGAFRLLMDGIVLSALLDYSSALAIPGELLSTLRIIESIVVDEEQSKRGRLFVD